MSSTNYGEKFRRFRETYRKPDGKKWTYVEVERATDGFVKANYLANLKAGRIRRPGIDRLCAISQVMGFPEELWLRKEGEAAATVGAGGTGEGGGTLADRLNALFRVLINRETGEPFTDREVADLTFGKLDERTIAFVRMGGEKDLEDAQYAALARAFGVDVSYWYARPNEAPFLNPGIVGAPKSGRTWAMLREYGDRSGLQKETILALLDELTGNEAREDRADKDGHLPKPVLLTLLITQR